MPRGTYFSLLRQRKVGQRKQAEGAVSAKLKATLVSARATPVPSLRTIEAVAVKTRPAASNIDPKNPAPLVPRSA